MLIVKNIQDPFSSNLKEFLFKRSMQSVFGALLKGINGKLQALSACIHTFDSQQSFMTCHPITQL